jgi:hypothetical protein
MNMNEKMSKKKDIAGSLRVMKLLTIIVVVCGAICIVQTISTHVSYKEKVTELVKNNDEKIANIQTQYSSTGEIVSIIRSAEFDLMVAKADIIANQNAVEQNIDTAYVLIQGKSEDNGGAMLKVLEERIKYVKQTMNTGDLIQAIEILKENFPDVQYSDLDNLIEKNNLLLNRIVKQKEAYNKKVDDYNKMYEDNREKLELINYAPINSNKYELDIE